MTLNKTTVFHPSLLEINTRVWLRRYDDQHHRATLADVPASFWDYLVEKKIDCLWLMGIWELADSAIEAYAFEAGLVESYRSALENWQPEDVIGSPYAIDQYAINPQIGTEEDLKDVKQQLNQRGIKLILDFVPNHFSAHSSLVATRPELFLQGNKRLLAADPSTYYKYQNAIFAHGKDPYFTAWQDTIQVNYFHPVAREFMQQTLLNLTNICDGLRVDMAMLALNKVFASSWKAHFDPKSFNYPQEEFWVQAIDAVRKIRPDFLLIAESYWDLEWQLQQQGFDFTYDKTLTDRLLYKGVELIQGHLRADLSYQNKLVRFLENHDEERAVSSFGEIRSRAAAVITSTIPGMRFYHLGQLEGRRIKLPVQLGREPVEAHCPCVAGNLLKYPNGQRFENPGLQPVCSCTHHFYDKLLELTHDPVFKKGNWRLAEFHNASPGILAWEWHWNQERRLVVVNYSDQPGQSRIRLKWAADQPFSAIDLIDKQQFLFSGESIQRDGLPLQLNPFWSWILKYEIPQSDKP